MNSPSLTDRQAEVLRFIARSLSERGFAPTIREIGKHLGITSTNGVNDHLKALERSGFIVRHAKTSRTLVLSRRGMTFIQTGAVR